MSQPGAGEGAASPAGSTVDAEEWKEFQAFKEQKRLQEEAKRKEMTEFEAWKSQKEGSEAQSSNAGPASGNVDAVQHSSLAPPTYEQSVVVPQPAPSLAPTTTPALARAPSPSLQQILTPQTADMVTKSEPCPQCKGKGKWNPAAGIIPFLAEKIAPSRVLETCSHCKGTGQLVTRAYRMNKAPQIGDNVRMGMVGMVGANGQMTAMPIVSTTGSRVGFVG